MRQEDLCGSYHCVESAWSALSVCPDSGHFVETTTILGVPTRIIVDSQRLEAAVRDTWLLCWFGQRLPANKTEPRPKRGLNPQVRTRMIGNPRVNYVRGDQ